MLHTNSWTVVLVFSTASTVAQVDDLTLSAGAKGPNVVDAVVGLLTESCVFPNDHLLLRRYAFVETSDGLNPSTYRPGFHGGIWAVNEESFLRAQNNSSMEVYYAGITLRFGINWTDVEWQELQKPLYSGLAAALFLTQSFGENIPVNVERQAEWYQEVVYPNDQESGSRFFTSAMQLDKECTSANLDLAFIVDTSSNMLLSDFNEIKNFVSSLVSDFNIGPNASRVAFVTFSSNVKVEFDFDDHRDKQSIQSAIHSSNMSGASGDTGHDLDFVSILFTEAGGSRPNSAKVAILVTKGRADNFANIKQSVAGLTNKGVNIFVIGVGDHVNTTQLGNLASQPACTHIQHVPTYQGLNVLGPEMKQLVCTVPVILYAGNYSFPCNTSSHFKVMTNGSVTIDIRPDSGSLEIYGAFLTILPNMAYKEMSTTISSGREAIVYLQEEWRPLYLTIVSLRNSSEVCLSGKYDIFVQNQNAIKSDALVTCEENGLWRQCGLLDILESMYTVTQPDAQTIPISCMNENRRGFYAYPNKYDVFIYCDVDGTAFLVFCPLGSWYNDGARLCVPGTPPYPPTTPEVSPVTLMVLSSPSTPSSGLLNPCSDAEEAYRTGQRFFPYPPDQTKYIACTEYPGFGVIKSCEMHHRWVQEELACIYTDLVVDPNNNIFVTTPRPIGVQCHPGMSADDQFFQPYSGDPTKFIQCDQYGSAFVHECDPGKVWNQGLLTCTPSGIFGGLLPER